MSSDPASPHKFGVSSTFLPGSLAEQEEAARLVEFARLKALRKAEEERMKPILAAEREVKYNTEREVTQERIAQQRAARANQKFNRS